MDRIGPAGGSPTALLTNGQQGFIDQNLGTGQQGTEVVAAFMNAVQEELMSILAGAGVTPNIANFGQVLSSLHTLFGGVGSVSVSGWVTLPGGLILQYITVSVPAGTLNDSFPLPTTFPTAFYGAVCSLGYAIIAGQPAVGAGPNTLGSVYISNTGSGGAGQAVTVIALGK